MITGMHAIIFAGDAGKTRTFLKDVLRLRSVDAGEGWLIFALPPAELGVHPAEGDFRGRHVLYLMCDHIGRTVADLKRRGVRFTEPVSDRGWGLITTMKVPGGGEISLYEPRHPTAIRRRPTAKRKARRRKRA